MCVCVCVCVGEVGRCARALYAGIMNSSVRQFVHRHDRLSGNSGATRGAITRPNLTIHYGLFAQRRLLFQRWIEFTNRPADGARRFKNTQSISSISYVASVNL